MSVAGRTPVIICQTPFSIMPLMSKTRRTPPARAIDQSDLDSLGLGRRFDTEKSDALLDALGIFHDGDSRRHQHGLLDAIALDADLDLTVEIELNELRKLLEIADRVVVQRDDPVARPQPGRRRR